MIIFVGVLFGMSYKVVCFAEDLNTQNTTAYVTSSVDLSTQTMIATAAPTATLAPTPVPTKKPVIKMKKAKFVKKATPKITTFINQKTKVIKGKGLYGTTVYVKAGGKTIGKAAVKVNNTFAVTIKPQKPKTKITIYSKYSKKLVTPKIVEYVGTPHEKYSGAKSSFYSGYVAYFKKDTRLSDGKYVKAGETCIVKGYYRKETINVVIYKNKKYRVSTYNLYIGLNYDMYKEAQKMKTKLNKKANAEQLLNKYNVCSKTNYLMLVSNYNKRVFVMKKDKNNNWKCIRTYLAAVGAYNTPTAMGEFTIYRKFNSFSEDNYTCWKWNQWYGAFAFHSVLYPIGTSERPWGYQIGRAVSHGCVRQDMKDAKWVYEKIPYDTKVVSF